MFSTKYKILLFFCIINLLVNCTKNDFTKRTGAIVIERRVLQNSFDSLIINDKIKIILIEDSIQYAEVKSGKNLLAKIKTEIIGNKLIVSNRNKFNWTRNIEIPIEIVIHTKNMTYLQFNGHQTVSCIGFPFTKSFLNIKLENCTGDLNLNLNCDWCLIDYTNGLSNLNLNGTCNNMQVYTGGIGKTDLQLLKSNNQYIRHNSIQSLYFTNKNYTELIFESTGNAYYNGDLSTINTNKTSQLIKI